MRASLPTVASAETTRGVNNKPANNAAAAPSFAPPKLAAGTVHMTNPGGGKLPIAPNMNPTHNYSSGMQNAVVRHKE